MRCWSRGGGWREVGSIWIALGWMVLVCCGADSLPALQRDRWYAKSGNMLVKPGEDGTSARESIELPIEVDTPNSPCGKQSREYLDSLLQKGPGSLEKQRSLSERVKGHRDLMRIPVRLDDEDLALAMISEGFARPLPSACSEEDLCCKRYQEAAAVASSLGRGCVHTTKDEDLVRMNTTQEQGTTDATSNNPFTSSAFHLLPEQLEVSARPSQPQILEPDITLPVGFKWQQVPLGLSFVTDFLFLDNGNLLLLRKEGQMRVVDRDSLKVLPELFLDFSDICSDFWDRGAMAMVKAPNYSSSRNLLIYFSYENDPRPEAYERRKTARVVRVKVNADESSAIRSSMEVVIGKVTGEGCSLLDGLDCISVDSRNHIGGGMTIAGGLLYVAVGDQAEALLYEGGHRAQQLGHYTGKVLRVNPYTGKGLKSNPYWRTGMSLNHPNAKIFSLGARSPFTLESTRGAAPVLVGDVMWETEEKVSAVVPGKNLGWPCWEANVFRADYLVFDECRNFVNSTRVHPMITWGRQPGGTAAAMVGEFIAPTGWPALYRNVRAFGDHAGGIMGFARQNRDGSLKKIVQTVWTPGQPARFRIDPTNRKLFVLELLQWRLQMLTFEKPFDGITAIETAPRSGARIPANGARIEVKLSVNPLPWTVGLNNVVLTRTDSAGGGTVRRAIELDFAHSTITILVKQRLNTGSSYELVLKGGPSGIRNLFGEQLEGEKIFHFTSAGAVSDTEPPRIVLSSPTRGQKAVSVTSQFQVRFSEAILSPVDTSLFKVLLRGTTPLQPIGLTNFAYDAISRTVSFKPLDTLRHRRCYYLNVSAQVRDLVGNEMDSAYQSGFCTERMDPNAITGKIKTPNLRWVDGVATARVNQRITFSGTMTTPDGVNVPPSEIVFEFVVNHCGEGGSGCHQHLIYTIRGDELRAINCPDHTGSFYYVLSMRASYAGYTGVVRRRIDVQTARVRFESIPSELEILVNGLAHTTPFEQDMPVNGQNYLFGPAVQQNGLRFKRWDYFLNSRRFPIPTPLSTGRDFVVGEEETETWRATYESP